EKFNLIEVEQLGRGLSNNYFFCAHEWEESCRRNEASFGTVTSDETAHRRKVSNTIEKMHAPSYLEIKSEGEMRGIPPEVCEKFFNRKESSGWTQNNGSPIIDWRSALTSFWRNWQENAARGGIMDSRHSGSRQAEEDELHRIDCRLQGARRETFSEGVERWDALVARETELRERVK